MLPNIFSLTTIVKARQNFLISSEKAKFIDVPAGCHKYVEETESAVMLAAQGIQKSSTGIPVAPQKGLMSSKILVFENYIIQMTNAYLI